MKLDFFSLNYYVKQALGDKYSLRDLIYNVKYRAWAA